MRGSYIPIRKHEPSNRASSCRLGGRRERDKRLSIRGTGGAPQRFEIDEAPAREGSGGREERGSAFRASDADASEDEPRAPCRGSLPNHTPGCPDHARPFVGVFQKSIFQRFVNFWQQNGSKNEDGIWAEARAGDPEGCGRLRGCSGRSSWRSARSPSRPPILVSPSRPLPLATNAPHSALTRPWQPGPLPRSSSS